MVVGVLGPYNDNAIEVLPLSCPKYGHYSLALNIDT